jgi:hypothetical protein
MYVYGLTQLKLVFITMYVQHLSHTFRPFFRRVIISLICVHIFTIQMWYEHNGNAPYRDTNHT